VEIIPREEGKGKSRGRGGKGKGKGGGGRNSASRARGNGWGRTGDDDDDDEDPDDGSIDGSEVGAGSSRGKKGKKSSNGDVDENGLSNKKPRRSKEEREAYRAEKAAAKAAEKALLKAQKQLEKAAKKKRRVTFNEDEGEGVDEMLDDDEAFAGASSKSKKVKNASGVKRPLGRPRKSRSGDDNGDDNDINGHDLGDEDDTEGAVVSVSARGRVRKSVLTQSPTRSSGVSPTKGKGKRGRKPKHDDDDENDGNDEEIEEGSPDNLQTQVEYSSS